MIVKNRAVVFPGQGSQAVGMLADIASQFPIVQQTFKEASDVLGYDLWALTQEGPATSLDNTVHTQPALLAAGIAIWRVLKQSTPIQPACFAGHSLGEYTALVAADAMRFTDAIRLVAARGAYMQEAVPAGQGALAAIVGLDHSAVAKICAQAIQANEVLSPANFNSPEQVVIAGHRVAVDRALLLAKEAGARLCLLLPVSVPSHCALMKSAADKLATLLTTISIQSPAIPVLNNVDVVVYTDGASIRDGLVRQLYMPVRWSELVAKMLSLHINEIIECGPLKVLNGLNKRIVPADVTLVNTNNLASLQAMLSEVSV